MAVNSKTVAALYVGGWGGRGGEGGVPGQGWSRGWAGGRWFGTVFVNVRHLSFLQTLISRPGWEPALSSGSSSCSDSSF